MSLLSARPRSNLRALSPDVPPSSFVFSSLIHNRHRGSMGGFRNTATDNDILQVPPPHVSTATKGSSSFLERPEELPSSPAQHSSPINVALPFAPISPQDLSPASSTTMDTRHVGRETLQSCTVVPCQVDRGKYAKRFAFVVRQTSCQVYVRLDTPHGELVRIPKSSLQDGWNAADPTPYNELTRAHQYQKENTVDSTDGRIPRARKIADNGVIISSNIVTPDNSYSDCKGSYQGSDDSFASPFVEKHSDSSEERKPRVNRRRSQKSRMFNGDVNQGVRAPAARNPQQEQQPKSCTICRGTYANRIAYIEKYLNSKVWVRLDCPNGERKCIYQSSLSTSSAFSTTRTAEKLPILDLPTSPDKNEDVQVVANYSNNGGSSAGADDATHNHHILVEERAKQMPTTSNKGLHVTNDENHTFSDNIDAQHGNLKTREICRIKPLPSQVTDTFALRKSCNRESVGNEWSHDNDGSTVVMDNEYENNGNFQVDFSVLDMDMSWSDCQLSESLSISTALSLPNARCAGMTIAGRQVDRYLLTEDGGAISRPPYNFIHFWAGSRIATVELPMCSPSTDCSPVVSKIISIGARTFTLVGSKVDDQVNGFMGRRKKVIQLVYVATSGPDLCSIDVRKELEAIADFGALNPRKAASRLELLQSPSGLQKSSGKNLKKPCIFYLKTEQLEDITENFHMGCGFIPETLLEDLLGNTVDARRTAAIQVRIVAPRRGIYKGMLFRKRNITKIQLPTSMQKVGPSLLAGANDVVFMLITTGGRHPTKSNHYMGRQLSVSTAKPPPPSYDSQIKKLSPMIQLLLRGLGVDKSAVGDYASRSLTRIGLKHAWCVGVVDPTNEISEGHIFVTGMGSEHGRHDELFITRSPCTEKADGRMLPVVHHKPKSMPDKEWTWLRSLPFGVVVFGRPKRSTSKGLPETIANGDLDGDLYFVCWDTEILASISSYDDCYYDETVRGDVTCIAVENKSSLNLDGLSGTGWRMSHDFACQVGLNSETMSSVSSSYLTDQDEMGVKRNNDVFAPLPDRSNWFELVQDVLIDTYRMQELDLVIRKLYSKFKAHATMSDELILNDDAVAFGRAYKHALDIGKHGGLIDLPVHLREKLPDRLKSFFKS